MPVLLKKGGRWLPLIVIAMTQLMVVLDGTIVNIALPHAQADLGLTDVQRQWVVTVYALVFGSLLLLGGRVADYWGRKRSFVAGMIGFGIASAIGGLAQNGTELLVARGLQGLFAALLAPAALALLTTTFTAGRDRQIAFAVFGAVAGSGAAVGLLLGGILTEFASWRWCLLVNLIFAVVGVVGGLLLVGESRADGDHSYDIWGAILVSLGFGALVFGFTLAEDSWTKPSTIGLLVAGVVLLVVFVLVEMKVKNPLMPLRIVLDGTRAGSFLVQALMGTVLIGATLFLTLYLQNVMHLTPLLTGLAAGAMTASTLISTPILTRLIERTGARMFMLLGPLLGAAGLILLSVSISPDGSYWTHVMPALILLGVGNAFIFIPLQNLALTGVANRDAGAASALVNSSLQIGGSIGLSVFSLVAARSLAAAGPAASMPDAMTGAYSEVFLIAGLCMAAAFVVSFFMVRPPKAQPGV
ncbi:MFS transporter [Pseudoclavibacter sp. CFCC 14310]|uniref:MFS transporter n=1 Tax=Pseudoclavibacter sp. CFCC 14310 TaxID=2615180 RepID=UPI001CE3EA7A|nr:MFS transporter [Pseudoclavibacter sp. CFCC 14310]